MVDKNKVVKIANREDSIVCYTIPESNINRQFMPRESKEVTFGELESLSFQPGGLVLLKDFLIIRDEEAAKEILGNVEPEYFYNADEVKKLLLEGSYDAFLDCLDFAPDGVLELVKDLAVTLPLNDMKKRQAILEKLDFDVTRAIEIQNTKYDGDSDEATVPEKPTRRVATTQIPVRRAVTPKAKTE